jgi:valyl-tRNA synthetase
MDAGQEEGDEGAVVLLVKDVRVVLPMTVDLDAERQRLENDKQAAEARIASLKARLSDDAFLSKAPPPVVEKERGKLVDSQVTLEKIEQRLAELGYSQVTEQGLEKP